jgi:hypothetical protein
LISFDTWDMLSEMKEGKIPVIVAFKNTWLWLSENLKSDYVIKEIASVLITYHARI